MARIVRIDSVRVSGGTITIGYTAGHDAVQATPSKQGFSYPSKAALIAAIRDLESRLSDEDLVLMAAATAFKADSTLSASAMQAIIGKTVAVRTQSDTVLVRVS